MKKLDYIENSPDKHKQNIQPEEQKQFIKEIKNTKVIPINEELECTLNHGSMSSSISKRLSNIKSKLLSFNSERMTTDLNNRYTFIRNVFLLLCFQSVTSIVFAVIALLNNKIENFIKDTNMLIIIASSTLGLIGLLMLVLKRIFKFSILKWIIFAIFILAKSILAAYALVVTLSYDLIILDTTYCGVCLSLAIYSIFSKIFFENKAALLIALLSCTIIFVVSLAITQEYYIRMIYIYFGILIFSIFTVYDIQLIAGGRISEFTYDDFVPTSLIVFIEIIAILFYIAKLLFKPI
ncbi:hypothetical protein SteCoe_12688 [Stentor coeruleus]|uniref:Uncharacterized protein n=1 Tax=Stentor coeruleus TaxID=5963 RepID=A0A1R2CA87_9CILI|nr:hypothetical protein SteCoe_12688 [Stentor coeruleus]